MKILPATIDDLENIIKWLREEIEQNHAGFWDCRNVIEDAFRDRELYVIRHKNKAVAFQTGKYSSNLVCVKQDMQNKGFGKALFKQSLKWAIEDDVTYLKEECSPHTSLPFWEKMGFNRYDENKNHKIMVRRTVPKTFSIQPGSNKVGIVISLCSESEEIPFETHRILGAQCPDGNIQLPERIIGYAIVDHEQQEDLVVKIEVAGKEIYFDKAKYSEAKSIGFKEGHNRYTFYIDQIILEQ